MDIHCSNEFNSWNVFSIDSKVVLGMKLFGEAHTYLKGLKQTSIFLQSELLLTKKNSKAIFETRYIQKCNYRTFRHLFQTRPINVFCLFFLDYGSNQLISLRMENHS